MSLPATGTYRGYRDGGHVGGAAMRTRPHQARRGRRYGRGTVQGSCVGRRRRPSWSAETPPRRWRIHRSRAVPGRRAVRSGFRRIRDANLV